EESHTFTSSRAHTDELCEFLPWGFPPGATLEATLGSGGHMQRKAGMITTDFRPGAPCWIELNTPDVPVSSEFYRKIFGWVTAPIEPVEAGYLMFYKDRRAVGAVGPLDHEQQRTAWTLFFA